MTEGKAVRKVDEARTVPPEIDAEITQPIAVHESWLPAGHPMYRPRHSRHQRSALLAAAVFLLVPVLATVLGPAPRPFENRPPTEFPSLSAGWEFFTQLSAWATDRLAFRQAGVLAEDEISRNIFGELPPRSQGENGAPFGPFGGQQQPGPGDNQRQLAEDDFPPVLQGQRGWLYLGQDVSYKCLPERGLDDVIGALRTLRTAVERSGRRFELVIPPDKSTMVPQHLPGSYAGKPCRDELTKRFWPRVTAEAGALDLRPPLQDRERVVGRELYDRDDTHWTYDGGVVMSYALAEAINPGSSAGWELRESRRVPWPADIPPLLGREVSRTLQSYTLAPDGKTDRTRYAASDFRTPLRFAPLGKQVRGQTAKPVGVIGDSFSQFASPFLGAAFRDLAIVHPETVATDPRRYATELLADKEVVVLELAERSVAGGQSPVLRPEVIAEIGRVLAANPVD